MLRLLAFASAALFLAGCGYVGEPLPPQLHIPQHVTDLAAGEHGGQIELTFTLPTHTTDGMVIDRPLTFEIGIGESPVPFRLDAWEAGVRRLNGAPSGKPTVLYAVPAADWVGKLVVIAVKILGANGRDNGWSNLVTLSVVPPLAAPAELQVNSAADGVHLAWRSDAPRFRIYRRVDDEPKAATLAETEHAEYTDATAEYGKAYHYAVEAIRTERDVRASSEPSAEVTTTPVDTFPPSVPSALAALASTGSIELVWNRDTEPDLAGYRVYRAVGDGPFEKLAETQQSPSYSDRNIQPGRKYRYAVSAFDNAGNESRRSAPVDVTAP
ncbi:MAG TPA: hypothetical protein VJN43_19645 [Bryobacteraceae bacterium]|nr:hypothetical protein [Bryobacteraceae bacterium]